MSKIVCVIPARLASTRFPRKILVPLAGKPLIQHVLEAASNCSLFDRIISAVDSEETATFIQNLGMEAIMTSKTCQNGMMRLLELRARGEVSADIWVNWQADEPFITAKMIETLLQSCENKTEEIWTLMKKIEKIEDICSPHVVKVVCDKRGQALFFSRSAIPYYREATHKKTYYKHLGLYAYRDRALQKMAHLSPCALEEAEKLEQLRYLFHGLKIRVHETDQENFGIDTPEEMACAQRKVSLRS